MFSVDTAVNYFLHKKFSYVAVIAPAMAKIDTDENSEVHKQLAMIDAYKAKLQAMPVNELERLYLDAQKQDINYEASEENLRFYNQKQATADFVHWSKAAHWSIEEAIALSFGKEPDLVSWAKIETYKDKSPFVKAYAKRRDLALRAASAKKLSDPVMPVVFINWAKEINIELPTALIEEVAKISHEDINWHKLYLKLKADYDALAMQSINNPKPESTRKSENLLLTLAAIAMVKYRFIPSDEKSKIPQEISDDLAKKGASVTAQTIRGWLKEGVMLLRK